MSRIPYHELKCIDYLFDSVKDGSKPFDVRKNDRGFQTGDIVELVKIDKDGYYVPENLDNKFSRQTLKRKITFILQGGQFGIQSGYCVLGLGSE